MLHSWELTATDKDELTGQRSLRYITYLTWACKPWSSSGVHPYGFRFSLIMLLISHWKDELIMIRLGNVSDSILHTCWCSEEKPAQMQGVRVMGCKWRHWGVGKEIDCCDAVRAFRFGFPSSEGVLVLWSCDSVLKWIYSCNKVCITDDNWALFSPFH